MKSVDRILTIDLPPGQSAFLWGPRKTGKSSFLRRHFPGQPVYDFLNTDLFLRMSREPHRLREELLAAKQHSTLPTGPIILDEIQKVPALLDEVHWLIENAGLQFILCGSSARKLKRGPANLLGGRAWRFEMFPLTFRELPSVDPMTALNSGLLPQHYFSPRPDRSLKAYIQDYLKEEIMQEGLIRRVPPFTRFLDSLAYSHGELTNFSNVARDCAVDAKTVRSYYDILVDTLLGRFVPPYSPKRGRQSISEASKFYLCDVGLAGSLGGRSIMDAKGEAFGRAFEHWILMELWAHRRYTEKDYEIRFWRTKAGLEVDFILGDGQVAVETKGASRIHTTDLRPLLAFCEDHSPKKAIVVCNEPEPRLVGQIEILPWREFLQRLWSDDII